MNVVGLHLSHNFLTGALPHWLKSITEKNAKHIKLSDNLLSGHLTEFNNMEPKKHQKIN